MFKKCVVNACNTVKEGDGVTLHKLPVDIALRSTWIRSLLNYTGQTVFGDDDVICSKHFSPEYFDSNILKPDAVPFVNTIAAPVTPQISDGPPSKRIKVETATNAECSVFTCIHTHKDTQVLKPYIIYYPFPKNKELAAKWQQFCNTNRLDRASSYVCSDHFTPDDFIAVTTPGYSGKSPSKTLKELAVPSVYKSEIKIEDSIEVGEPVIQQITDPQASALVSANLEYSGDNSNSVSFIPEEKICAIETCESRTSERADIEYYPVPSQYNARKTWLKLIQNNTKQTELPHNAFICSLHFASECFRKNPQTNKNILLVEAVPTIFSSPLADKDDFPLLSDEDLANPECVKSFYEWSQKNHFEQKDYIKFLKGRYSVQARRIARLAKSVDDFKAKKAVSEEANNALQILFDKIIDTQFDVI